MAKANTKKTTLIATKTIRCNGHLHTIGLNSKGQLHIPNHSKSDLEKYIMMGDMGNNPCKCAVVLDAWRCQNHSNSMLPEVFKQWAPDSHGRLAARLLRHKQRERRKAGISSEPVLVARRTEPGSEYTEQEPYITCEMVINTTVATLKARGYDLTNALICPDLLSIDNATIVHCIRTGWGNNAYVNVVLGGHWTIPGVTIRANTPIDALPWHSIIDGAEGQLLHSIVLNKQRQGLEQNIAEFNAIAADKVGTAKMPNNCSIKILVEQGLVDLSIKHPGLTIHTAQRMIKYYSKTQSTINRLLDHNLRNTRRPHRYPGKPKKNFAPLSKNRTTLPGCTITPADTDEPY